MSDLLFSQHLFSASQHNEGALRSKERARKKPVSLEKKSKGQWNIFDREKNETFEARPQQKTKQ
jgi:hypothetical protein